MVNPIVARCLEKYKYYIQYPEEECYKKVETVLTIFFFTFKTDDIALKRFVFAFNALVEMQSDQSEEFSHQETLFMQLIEWFAESFDNSTDIRNVSISIFQDFVSRTCLIFHREVDVVFESKICTIRFMKLYFLMVKHPDLLNRNLISAIDNLPLIIDKQTIHEFFRQILFKYEPHYFFMNHLEYLKADLQEEYVKYLLLQPANCKFGNYTLAKKDYHLLATMPADIEISLFHPEIIKDYIYLKKEIKMSDFQLTQFYYMSSHGISYNKEWYKILRFLGNYNISDNDIRNYYDFFNRNYEIANKTWFKATPEAKNRIDTMLEEWEVIANKTEENLKWKPDLIQKDVALKNENETYLFSELFNSKAFNRTAEKMQHCVKHYAYKAFVGECTIITVSKNIQNDWVEMLTLEIKGKKVIQCRGFQNRAPTSKELRAVLLFCEEQGLKYSA